MKWLKSHKLLLIPSQAARSSVATLQIKRRPAESRRLELMLSLPVHFDFHTWSAMFVMIVTVSLVHVATAFLAHVIHPH
jgi:hypothetical protein